MVDHHLWLPQAAPASVPDSLVGQDRRLSPARPGFNSRSGNQAPPELRWQSGRLLTDRSLVRSQVVAIRFATFFGIFQKKWKRNRDQGQHEPMAQRQRVGFQTRRLGVQIPLGSYLFVFFFTLYPTLTPHMPFTSHRIASRAPLAERSAVNRQVLGSIPSGGAIFFFTA